MSIRSALKATCHAIYDKLNSECFKEIHRMSDKDFTRDRKLSFAEVSLVILKGAKHGIHTAITEALSSIRSDIDSYSAAALCKARQKINFTAFLEIFELTAKKFYETATNRVTYKGFRVWAVDGSKINLPTNDKTLEEFGSEPFSHGLRAQALASCLFDVLNGITLTAEFERFDANERDLALRHVLKLQQYCAEKKTAEKELILFDRGYPSEKLIDALQSAGFYFIFRVNKNNFWKEVREAEGDDTEITHNGVKLRIIRRPLAQAETTKGGNVETMITILTNLSEEEYEADAVMDLYRLRWRIETNYNYLKNRIELESFTGLSPLCIRQDFYSALFMCNLIACTQYDMKMQEKDRNSNRKYEYKINYAETYRCLRTNIFELILAENNYQYHKAYHRLRKGLKKALTPVRPNRNPQRSPVHYDYKFLPNHKGS